MDGRHVAFLRMYSRFSWRKEVYQPVHVLLTSTPSQGWSKNLSWSCIIRGDEEGCKQWEWGDDTHVCDGDVAIRNNLYKLYRARLYPPSLRKQTDDANACIYNDLYRYQQRGLQGRLFIESRCPSALEKLNALLKTHDFVIGDAVTEWHTGIHHALAPCPNLSQPHEAQRSLFVWLRCRVEMDGSHDGTWRLLPMPSKAISGARATVPYPLAQEATPIAMVAPGLSHKGSLDGIRGVDHDECWPWRNMLYFTFICHNLQWVLLCHCFQKEHSTRSASRNRSCFIIFPCPYCFLIVFDIYLIIFCYILLLHLTRYQSEPHKRQVNCCAEGSHQRRAYLRTGAAGGLCVPDGREHLHDISRRQGQGVLVDVFPIFALTDQVIETIWNQVFSRCASEEALGDDLVFQSSVDLEDVKISEGMKAGKWRRTMEQIWKNPAWFQNYPTYLGYVGMMIHKYPLVN